MSESNASATRFVERFVTLLEERARVGEDVRDLMTEAKSAGHMPAAIRKTASDLFKIRQETAEQAAKRQALEDEVARIKSALGEFSSSPLGMAALASAE